MSRNMDRGGGSCRRRVKGSFVPSEAKKERRMRKQAPTPGEPIETGEEAGSI